MIRLVSKGKVLACRPHQQAVILLVVSTLDSYRISTLDSGCETGCLTVSLYSASDFLEMYVNILYIFLFNKLDNNNNNDWSALKIVKYLMFENHVLCI